MNRLQSTVRYCKWENNKNVTANVGDAISDNHIKRYFKCIDSNVIKVTDKIIILISKAVKRKVLSHVHCYNKKH